MARVNRRSLIRGGVLASAQLATGAALAQNEVSAAPPTEATFRVLSLDGGGARGYLTARILANIELTLDAANKDTKPVGQRFDFIAGTSTGGIIALGLATGRTAAEIVSFYETLVPVIFAEKMRTGYPGRIRRPQYDNKTLKAHLERFFGNATLENVKTDVCITGVALATGKPRFYKSYYQAANLGRQKEKLSDVALGTSAAPTYFKAHTLAFTDRMIDGGICANNPSIVALVEAMNFERPSYTRNARPRAMGDIIMVSIGTGEQPSMPYNADTMAEAGLYYWAQYIADVMFESQSAVADTQARFLLREKYLRLNPKLGMAMPLDDVDHLNHLKTISDLNRSNVEFLHKYFVG